MFESIKENLTTITEGYQKTIIDKCEELNFDINRGLVPLDECYINLNHLKAVLIGAERKFNLLPLSVQNTISKSLQQISTYQSKLIDGEDQVENLTGGIEALNVIAWQYRLHDLSDAETAYHEKVNQLKGQEHEANQLKKELNRGTKSKEKLEKVITQAEADTKTLAERVLSADKNLKTTSECANSVTECQQEASARLETIRHNEEVSTTQLAATQQSNAKIASHENSIVEFFEKIEEYNKKMDATTSMGNDKIQANDGATKNLIARLNDLEDEIGNQMQKATGFSLFHSFQTRQKSIFKSKVFWASALILFVIAAIGVPVYTLITSDQMDIAFFLKLAASIPIIYVITFCNIQYSRERKLEEEYAFKSNISISLIPYKELVETLVKEGDKESQTKYTNFIIETINKVFTSPTRNIFDEKKGSIEKSLGGIKDLEAVLLKVIKEAKSK